MSVLDSLPDEALVPVWWVREQVEAAPEQDPAMDKSELLRHLWRREAVRNIHHPAPPWQNGSSGATPKDGRA